MGVKYSSVDLRIVFFPVAETNPPNPGIICFSSPLPITRSKNQTWYSFNLSLYKAVLAIGCSKTAPSGKDGPTRLYRWNGGTFSGMSTLRALDLPPDGSYSGSILHAVGSGSIPGFTS